MSRASRVIRLRRHAVLRVLVVLLAVLAPATAPIRAAAQGPQSAEERAAAAFEASRDNPLLLHAFLKAMPKGGDLHNHPSGAEFAEQYIAYAAEEGLCVLRETMTLVPPPCDAAAARPPVSDALRQQALYDALVDAWSMRDWVSESGVSGHDQFFGTFDRFGLASSRRVGDVIANAMSRAAGENLQYLELMFGVDRGAASELGGRIGWNDDLGVLYGRYQAEGMENVVAQSRAFLDSMEARVREVLACDSPKPDPGCRVAVRYIQTGTRVLPPERVFAQLAAGFALVKADPRVVGVNLVAPEDAYVARRDYRLHMTMLDFLHQQAPETPVALHAGELAPGLVPPEDLRFHIRDAVERGHARRIGHGVDLFYEDEPFALLADMARRNVLVEIALVSNDQILGVKGAHHPFPLYRRVRRARRARHRRHGDLAGHDDDAVPGRRRDVPPLLCRPEIPGPQLAGVRVPARRELLAGPLDVHAGRRLPGGPRRPHGPGRRLRGLARTARARPAPVAARSELRVLRGPLLTTLRPRPTAP